MTNPNCVIPFTPTEHCIVRTVEAIHKHQLVPYLVCIDNLDFNSVHDDDDDDEMQDDKVENKRHMVEKITDCIKDCYGSNLVQILEDEKQGKKKKKSKLSKSFCLCDSISDIQRSSVDDRARALMKYCVDVAISQGHARIVWPEEFSFILREQESLNSENRVPVTWISSPEHDDPTTDLLDLCIMDQELVDQYIEECEQDGDENKDVEYLCHDFDKVDGLKFTFGKNVFEILHINPTGYEDEDVY